MVIINDIHVKEYQHHWQMSDFWLRKAIKADNHRIELMKIFNREIF